MTIEAIQSLNHVLAIGGLLGIIVTTLLVIDLCTKRIFTPYITKWSMWFAFVTTLGTVCMTLFYSEKIGIVPCGFCWLERIFLFPQVFIIATGLYCKDVTMPRYGVVLSSVGFVISLYHHYIQMGGSEFVRCPVSGGVDCAKRFFFEFDFMTFPLLGAIFFAFLITLYTYALKVRTHA